VTNRPQIKLLPPTFLPWLPKKVPSMQIAVLMSGSVDSSVAAYLLKEEGWDVLGITMKMPVTPDISRRLYCGSKAAVICRKLNIPHYFINVFEPFNEFVIEKCRRYYLHGQAPNLCIDCNTFLKFLLVWDFIEEVFGITHLATGHYARILKYENKARLGRAIDKLNDQSYFLYGIRLDRLPRLVLPLGQLTKLEVCSMATELDMHCGTKPECMKLCCTDVDDYQKASSEAQSNQCYNIIGEHKDISNYAFDIKEQAGCTRITANQVNVLIPDELQMGRKINGKIHSYDEPQPCLIMSERVDILEVDFEQPQFAPCPGQRLVLYNDKDEIIAGGII